jgi:ubiquinone/menaquinone biosynthesis C-methylase UbiE
MVIPENDKPLRDRTPRLTSLIQHVKPGKIIELGCGSGMVLETLSAHFTDSAIAGVDMNANQLEKVIEKNLRNVIPIEGDITQKIFPDRTFDTVLFVASLHEVFSYRGRRKVRAAIQMAHDILMDAGVLIIQDFLKPPSRSVDMGFYNEETSKKFLRFAREYCPRRIKFEETEHGATLDIADAIEFISKYRSPTEEDWKQEMRETHFFFTEVEFQKLAQKTGLTIRDLKKLQTDENWWLPIREDLELSLEPEHLWIQLVLTKGEGK